MSYQIHVHHKDGVITHTTVTGELPDGHHVIAGHHGRDHNLAVTHYDHNGHHAASVGSQHSPAPQHQQHERGEHHHAEHEHGEHDE